MSIQLCPVTNKFVWIREEDIGANVYTQMAGATTKAIICNMLILITWNPTMRPVRWDELREPRGGQQDDLMKPVASYPGQVISLCPLDRQDLDGREGRQAARLRLTCFIYLDGSFYHVAPPGPRLASKSNQIRRKHQQVWPGILMRLFKGPGRERRVVDVMLVLCQANSAPAATSSAHARPDWLPIEHKSRRWLPSWCSFFFVVSLQVSCLFQAASLIHLLERMNLIYFHCHLFIVSDLNILFLRWLRSNPRPGRV